MSDNLDKQVIGLLSELRDPFGRLPNIIVDFYGPGMKQAGWVYSVLVRFLKFDDSTTFVGLKTITETTGVDLKTVLRYIEHLENLGVIRVERDKTWKDEKRKPKPNIYTLVLPPLPPPPEIQKQYFPKDWTPPERALKALKNIRNNLDFAVRPQEAVPPKGDTGMVPVIDSKSESSQAGVSGKVPVTGSESKDLKTRGSGATPVTPWQEDSKTLASRQTNKSSLTRDIYQEETENNKQEQGPFVCAEAFINKIISEARTIDPNLTREQIRSHITQAAKIESNDPKKVEERLWSALQAAMEYVIHGKRISNFKRWYMTAVINGFKPNAQVAEQEDEAEAVSEFEEHSSLSYEDILFAFSQALSRLGPGMALQEYRDKLKTHPDWPRAEKTIILKHKLKFVDDVAQFKHFDEYTEEDILDFYEGIAFLERHERKMKQMIANFQSNPNWEKAKAVLDPKKEKGE